MQVLLDSLPQTISIYQMGTLAQKKEVSLSKQELVEIYGNYLSGQEVSNFHYLITCSKDSIYQSELDDGRVLIKPKLPSIGLSLHSFSYLPEAKEIKPSAFGSNTIRWGVKFSYPQIYQDPKTGEIFNVLNNPLFENSQLFSCLQKKIREMTLPAFFQIEEQLLKTPLRLGRACFDWINDHPQLKQRKIRVRKFAPTAH